MSPPPRGIAGLWGAPWDVLWMPVWPEGPGDAGGCGLNSAWGLMQAGAAEPRGSGFPSSRGTAPPLAWTGRGGAEGAGGPFSSLHRIGVLWFSLDFIRGAEDALNTTASFKKVFLLSRCQEHLYSLQGSWEQLTGGNSAKGGGEGRAVPAVQINRTAAATQGHPAPDNLTPRSSPWLVCPGAREKRRVLGPTGTDQARAREPAIHVVSYTEHPQYT